MIARRIRLGSLSTAIVVLLAVPAGAAAAPYVPPGNSAATQYTEAVPTAGGPKATNESKQGKHTAPSKVLGHSNAKRLDSQGPEGRAAAEVAAETAPAPVAGDGGEPAAQATHGSGSSSGQAAGGGGVSSSGHQDASGAPKGGATTETAKSSPPQSSGGSSAVGEIVGQATGASSSNPLGLLLPLLIAAVLVWSVVYFLRHRRRPTG